MMFKEPTRCERATPPESPKRIERIKIPETTKRSERAKRAETTIDQKRAIRPEKTSLHERASMIETSNDDERAIAAETSMQQERAKRVKKECESWALGFAEGLAHACGIVREQPELAQMIAEEGWRRFGERFGKLFEDELKIRNLDLAGPPDEKETS